MPRDALVDPRRTRSEHGDFLAPAKGFLRSPAIAFLDENEAAPGLDVPRLDVERSQEAAAGFLEIAPEHRHHGETVRRRRGMGIDRPKRRESHDRVIELFQLELAKAQVFVDGGN